MMFGRGIPCVVVAVEDPDPNRPTGYIKGVRTLVPYRVIIGNTASYWGAKRLVQKIKKIRPDLRFEIREAWHHPYLNEKDSE